MDIKIIVATHKQYWMPIDSVYLPLQVGAEGKPDLGYIKDNTGDNISYKNEKYCELTGIYWAWKNINADYIGVVHYRRYFTRRRAFEIKSRKKQILLRTEWEYILKEHPVVVTDKRKYYIETNRSHYNHAHYPEGLNMTERIIKEKYPDYDQAFQNIMDQTGAHMFNMFVMRRDYYIAYCRWLFSILFELEKHLDTSQYDTYQSRVFGFVAERLLDVWLKKNEVIYVEQHVSFLEKQNWLKKGGNFLKRKIRGKQ